MRTMAAARVQFGRVPVDVVTFAQALDALEQLIVAGQGGAVFTPNVDHVVNAEVHAEFAAAYEAASLSVADGMPLVWASRLLGAQLPERVAGSDLIGPVLERAGQRKWRVFMLGADPGVADKAAAVALARYGTHVVGTAAPLVRLDDGAQLAAIEGQLNAARPHLVLMAFGAPKQELLIHRLAPRIRPAVSMGIGASLDFVAGTVRRAPAVVRDLGLEWFYRLAQEPRRLWRRYLVNDPKFLLILARQIAANHLGTR